jgi:single-strand DNA-binding protein
MAYLNRQQVIGNLGRDPELRYTASGSAVTQATVAATRRYQQNGEWTEQTEWFRLVIWGESGERFAEKMHRGDRVYVEGRTETREYQGKDGEKRRSTELNVQMWQDLVDRRNRDENGDTTPTRRQSGGGSRQERGDPPAASGRGSETPPKDDLSDLDDLPF